MKKSLALKLEQLSERFEEINRLLADRAIIDDQTQFKALSKEYAQLEPVHRCYQEYLNAHTNFTTLTELKHDKDTELASLANDELPDAEHALKQLEEALQAH
jgi:peptide chain release factor 1